MATIIDRIVSFENNITQTVSEFCKAFPKSNFPGVSSEDEVTIGKPLGPETTRQIIIGTKEFSYNFKEGVSELMKKEIQSNEDFENAILAEKEMQMGAFEYLMLQYFRGASSPYHTSLEIANKLKCSDKGIRNVMRRMEESKIITIKPEPSLHKTLVTINEEWL